MVDTQTARPVAPPVPTARRALLVRLAGSDPGLTRLRSAVQAVLSIAAILGAEWCFVHFTHALQLASPGPAAAAANHQYLVIAMLLGAIVGMLSSIGVMDPTPRGQLLTMGWLPVPMIGALALGVAVGGHRLIALCGLAAILSVGTYFRRFGPRGAVSGMVLFMGYFFGFFLHGAVTLSDLGWLAAEIGVGVVVAIAVRFGLFPQRPARTLARIERSYAARARKVAASALRLFDDRTHSEGQVRALQRQLVRLNEAALMIDAQLGDPGAVAEEASAQRLHQRLFDVELALTNVARFAQAMGRMDLPVDQVALVRQALAAIVGRDGHAAGAHADGLVELLGRTAAGAGPALGPEGVAVVVVHRFAGSVAVLAEAMTEWEALGLSVDGPEAHFQPAVLLFGGWLPGSAQVSAAASLERGRRPGDRATLAPYTRTAIQVGVAVGGAIALGDVVSGRRFYWAVIAAFITFMGANNAGEQARKALFRVAGTVVGIVIGSLLAHAVGHRGWWSIAVILVSLFFGFYLMRVNYAFMVVGITVMVSQLYVQLGEFSNSLLGLRLEETAIGAGVATLVVMLVLPLRTRRVLRIALRAQVEALAQLADHATGHLLGEATGTDTALRADARQLDATHQAVVATVAPLRWSVLGDFEEVGSVVHLAAAARHYGRSLVTDIESVTVADADVRLDVAEGRRTLLHSLEVVAEAFNGPRDEPYVRSASLFDRAERRLAVVCGGVNTAAFEHGQLAIRDLQLIDGAMAAMSERLHLEVTDYDTVALPAR